jgi:hypothetical protein
VTIRDGEVGDLDAIAEMLEDFVVAHPAKSRPRSRDKLRVTALYDRVTHSWPEQTHALSGEAFQRIADLAGASAKEIVLGLPSPEVNRVPAEPRER